MPELPEVITVCNMLREIVKGKTIVDTKIFYTKLLHRPSIDEFKKKTNGQEILNVFNRAKYIIIELKSDVIISHLRMEGKWIIEQPDTFAYPERHLEAQFLLSDGIMMRYYDTRKFGTMELIAKDKYESIPPISKLGLDPIKDKISSEYLFEKLKSIRRPIKSVLLDQNILSGIGNIYANEILFASKISPYVSANKLSLENCGKILKISHEILVTSVEKGGTTIHSFESAKGVKGGYQDYLQVHGKAGKHCVICKTIIEKDYIGGRGTYFCPNCQK